VLVGDDPVAVLSAPTQVLSQSTSTNVGSEGDRANSAVRVPGDPRHASGWGDMASGGFSG
jgi:hypothetical protein